MKRDIHITPGHNPSVTLQLDMNLSEPLVPMWFELVVGEPYDINLCLGTCYGSRPVAQTLWLSLSDAYCPFSDLARLAERAATYSQLPFTLEIDSEGPESVVSLLPGPVEGAAIFEIRELDEPVVYFAALVDAQQFGLALAHALRSGIENPAYRYNWVEWAHHGGNAMDYFGSSWLRDVRMDEHPSKDWYYDGIDEASAKRFRSR